jgi:mono/diheme cytochrome c family protein
LIRRKMGHGPLRQDAPWTAGKGDDAHDVGRSDRACQGARNAAEHSAEAWCVECHAVAPGDREPSAVAILRPEKLDEFVIVETPAFQAAADDPAVTEVALRVFLQTPHANMPDLRLTPAQTDDVIAYILSLKGDRPGT